MNEYSPATMMDIYTEYIRLRRDGWSTEAVVKALRSLAEQLDQEGLAQLNALVTQWEGREGARHMPSRRKMAASEAPAPSPVPSPPTQVPPQPPGQPVIRSIAPPPGREGRAASEESAGAFGLSAPAGKQFCPRCGKPNRVGDNYCYACGHLLQTDQVGMTKAFTDEESEQRERWGTAFLSETSYVVLVVRGGARPIRVPVKDEVTLGRAAPNNPIKPDIDLSAFKAEELGVSRIHASLRREENTIHIVDLASKNHTYLNAQRVYPRESRVLHNGDEIRLGRLPITVMFKHAER
jgi:hypothetical protein